MAEYFFDTSCSEVDLLYRQQIYDCQIGGQSQYHSECSLLGNISGDVHALSLFANDWHTKLMNCHGYPWFTMKVKVHENPHLLPCKSINIHGLSWPFSVAWKWQTGLEAGDGEAEWQQYLQNVGGRWVRENYHDIV